MRVSGICNSLLTSPKAWYVFLPLMLDRLVAQFETECIKTFVQGKKTGKSARDGKRLVLKVQITRA